MDLPDGIPKWQTWTQHPTQQKKKTENNYPIIDPSQKYQVLNIP